MTKSLRKMWFTTLDYKSNVQPTPLLWPCLSPLAARLSTEFILINGLPFKKAHPYVLREKVSICFKNITQNFLHVQGNCPVDYEPLILSCTSQF